MGNQGTISPTTAVLPDFIKARDIFAGGASPAPTSVAHVFPATGPQVETVDLFDFNFLGKRFASHNYKEIKSGVETTLTGRGVSKPMAQRLLLAQEEIFRLFLARRNMLQAGAAATALTEAEFDEFCGIIAPHGGWGFRKGKHSLGCAIDIDVPLNPYVATRTRASGGDVFGGELGGFSTDAAKVALLQQSVFRPAVEVYDRAFAMVFGSQGPDGFPAAANVGHFGKGANAGESFEGAWFRFYKVHRALEYYFSLAFKKVPPANQQSLTIRDPHNQGIPFEAFRDGFLLQFQADGFQAKHPEIVSAMNADQEGFLRTLHKQIIDDHALVRKVMVAGNLKVDAPQGANQFANARAETSRDPCYGLMTHRKETVVGMCTIGAGGLRWGACQFGDRANGDVMHFDMGEGFRPSAADGLKSVTLPAGTHFEKF